MQLEGKVAIITGAGSGIGRGIAQRFAQEGARIVVADINLEAAEKTVAEIESAGGRAMATPVDVRRPDSVQAMVDAAVAQWGGLDILVNNAGVSRVVPFLEITEDDWNFMFDVNCKGVLWCSQAAARVMIAQGRGGKIINLASVAGRRGEALALTYCASKACVINVNQSIALALAPHKINVNAIAPSVVDTPFWIDADKQFARILNLEEGEAFRQFVGGIPLGRVEQPADVAAAALFLASPAADYITQQCLNVDGGVWGS